MGGLFVAFSLECACKKGRPMLLRDTWSRTKFTRGRVPAEGTPSHLPCVWLHQVQPLLGGGIQADELGHVGIPTLVCSHPVQPDDHTATAGLARVVCDTFCPGSRVWGCHLVLPSSSPKASLYVWAGAISLSRRDEGRFGCFARGEAEGEQGRE